MSDRILVGTRKGLFRIARNNGKWQVADAWFLGAEVPMVLRDPADEALYAALHHGHFGEKLHRSDNDGKTWDEVAAPEYPPMPEGREPDRCPMRGIEIPWALKLIWSLESDGQGNLWCGTLPGGLFTSSDRGASWRLIESLWNKPNRAKWMGGGYDYPGIHSICIHPANPRHVQVAISSGGVWTTADAGDTWTVTADGLRNEYMPPDQAGDPDVQDPHRMVQCPADPNHLWIQHHNGIFRSTDGAQHWTEIHEAGPSTFGFAVAVHPRDPDTAWFVPGIKDEARIPVDGKFVVTRTRDGGKSFDVLSDGLPGEHAYDMVFRHCLDIDAAGGGDRLAMGSTTGSLWITENSGDQWQTVSNHLPPIYVVRFI